MQNKVSYGYWMQIYMNMFVIQEVESSCHCITKIIRPGSGPQESEIHHDSTCYSFVWVEDQHFINKVDGSRL